MAECYNNNDFSERLARGMSRGELCQMGFGEQMIGRTTLLCGAGLVTLPSIYDNQVPSQPSILLKGTCHDGCTPGAPPTPGRAAVGASHRDAGDRFLGWQGSLGIQTRAKPA